MQELTFTRLNRRGETLTKCATIPGDEVIAGQYNGSRLPKPWHKRAVRTSSWSCVKEGYYGPGRHRAAGDSAILVELAGNSFLCSLRPQSAVEPLAGWRKHVPEFQGA